MTVNLETVRALGAALRLSDQDLDGDAVVHQIAELKSAIDALDADSEPWLIKWLGDEHYKGAAFYAAAKMNKLKNDDANLPPFDPQTRSVIISRFNSWAPELVERIELYSSSARSAAVVAPWILELAKFKADPVHSK